MAKALLHVVSSIMVSSHSISLVAGYSSENNSDSEDDNQSLDSNDMVEDVAPAQPRRSLLSFISKLLMQRHCAVCDVLCCCCYQDPCTMNISAAREPLRL